MKVAVLDFGKTNSKLFVFGQDGRIIDERRTQPKWVRQGGFSVLDEAALHHWALSAVADAVDGHGVEGVMVSGHGCTFALVDEAALTHPILDYEQEPPAEIAARIDRRIPDFSETFSPRLPLGFNYGRHMLWLQEVDPDAFAASKSILGYPQYWSWRLGGRAVSEVSYLGCHSHLWAPRSQDFSSLVDAQGWRDRMPAFERAGTVIGEQRLGAAVIAIHNGVHDSNAALHAYRRQELGPVTVVSTGTWVIVLNPDCPLDALDRDRDMLVNVDVGGGPVPTIRFMGGREFATISAGWQGEIAGPVVQRVIDAGIMALPSFAPGGPMAGHSGRLVGRTPDAEERAAAALLYVALMVDLCLDLIHSNNTVIVDGGLNTGGVLAGLLAQLRPGQAFLQGATLEGSATGAAALAFESVGREFAAEVPEPVRASRFTGLAGYRSNWRDATMDRGVADAAAGGAR
ncbi:carbohydrate kinase [Mesorhizobium sp. M7A.F.Ca.MR.245.00.0.0]|uniref:carbohydrate kinase n=1 Tax=Mesorhizobium sp. M7A.F.Ca.MR.245.00.0.0 TaxID=2496778 RepID=UPI000FCB8FEE|nr:carbohydrate kinase [Mesorhizobium sp. M7A.F.Ca.MR.245.00.0.0]RUV18440.1 carbohydrate kinase [Mesorhizobium sp. M7A.F.Ca.MR.245.00.0.0]RUV51410.1 carbohydrate kinase [Mesorhizobium sp. M7A.F.Ca.MR.228.00.0.0]RWO37986.1 MAG: carbohydrate kinase [Mesorhizobium sp.]